MNTSITTTIAPVLRGLTFDGRKGAIIAAIDEPAARVPADRVMALEDVPEDADAMREALASGYAGYLKKHGTRPFLVRVSTVGGTTLAFGIGDDVDSARNPAEKQSASPAGATAAPGEAAAGAALFNRRADVVRGRVSVVTGGAQGFGEGIVRALVAGGSVVCIADLNLAGASELAESLNTEYGRTVALAVGANVAEEESVRKMVEEIVSLVGGIDLFVSNAGVLKAGSVTELSLKDFNFVTTVNYVGFFLCSKHVAPVMALQNSGSGGRYFTDIVQINSKSGLEGSNKNGAYAGSKFGGIGLVQSFALELVTDNIKVNAVCPGNFFEGPLWADPDRGLFVQYLRAGKVPGARSVEDVKRFYESKVPMQRGCRPADVVRSICYIVEQEYETGQAVPVTGGQTMLN